MSQQSCNVLGILWLFPLQVCWDRKQSLSPTVHLSGTVTRWQARTWNWMFNCGGESELCVRTLRNTVINSSVVGETKWQLHFNMNIFQLLTVQFELKCDVESINDVNTFKNKERVKLSTLVTYLVFKYS